MFRTHAIIGIVTVANSILAAGIYYPIPLIGPIIAGTRNSPTIMMSYIIYSKVLGSLGAFLPFDKGLAAVTAGTPWPIQAAFLTAVIY